MKNHEKENRCGPYGSAVKYFFNEKSNPPAMLGRIE